MDEPWWWHLVDALLILIAGCGAIFAVVIAAYVLYRAAQVLGLLITIMFGGRPLDGVAHYDEDDFP